MVNPSSQAHFETSIDLEHWAESSLMHQVILGNAQQHVLRDMRSGAALAFLTFHWAARVSYNLAFTGENGAFIRGRSTRNQIELQQ